MTTATQSQNEALIESLSELEASEICKLVAIVARKKQKETFRTAARYEAQSYKQDDTDEGDAEYRRLQDLAEDTNQIGNGWEELADTMKSLGREL